MHRVWVLGLESKWELATERWLRLVLRLVLGLVLGLVLERAWLVLGLVLLLR